MSRLADGFSLAVQEGEAGKGKVWVDSSCVVDGQTAVAAVTFQRPVPCVLA